MLTAVVDVCHRCRAKNYCNAKIRVFKSRVFHHQPLHYITTTATTTTTITIITPPLSLPTPHHYCHYRSHSLLNRQNLGRPVRVQPKCLFLALQQQLLPRLPPPRPRAIPRATSLSNPRRKIASRTSPSRPSPTTWPCRVGTRRCGSMKLGAMETRLARPCTSTTPPCCRSSGPRYARPPQIKPPSTVRI